MWIKAEPGAPHLEATVSEARMSTIRSEARSGAGLGRVLGIIPQAWPGRLGPPLWRSAKRRERQANFDPSPELFLSVETGAFGLSVKRLGHDWGQAAISDSHRV